MEQPKDIAELTDYQKAYVKIMKERRKLPVTLAPGCLAKGTPIQLWNGENKKIENVKSGDFVISYDEYNDKYIANEVDTVFRTCHKPKPMIQFTYENETITTTYDHPFYNGEGFYPIYQLLWGKMEASERFQLKLLCKQYGTTFNYKETRGKHSCCNETCSRCVRLFQDSDGRKNSKSSSSNSSKLARKSKKISSNKSYKRKKRRQSSRKFRMVYLAVQRVDRIQERINKKTSIKKRNIIIKQRQKVHKRILYKKHTTFKDNREEKSVRFFTKKISTSKKNYTMDNSDWKIKIKTQEPYYTLSLKSAPYTYCIGKRNYFITHNSGKTIICLYAITGKALIIVPKEQFIDQSWQNNAKKFDISVDFTIMSKEMFRRDWEKLPRYDTIIIDEYHNFLGIYPDTRRKAGETIPKTSQMFDALYAYLQKTAPESIFLVSATPVSKPMNVLATAWFLGHRWDYFKFRDAFYIDRASGFRTLWLPKKDKKTKERLANAFKSLGAITGELSDWYDVPEQHEQELYVTLNDEQKDKINYLELTEADPMRVRAKRRQIENGFMYSEVSEIVNEKEFKISKQTIEIGTDKYEFVKLITQKHPKVLFFVNWKAQIALLDKYLQELGIETFILTGETKNRKQLKEKAEQSTRCAFIAQSNISAGYELPSFRAVVFLSKSYRHLDYYQGKGRVLRQNALHENYYYHIITKGGLDELCHKTIMSGQDFIEKLYD